MARSGPYHGRVSLHLYDTATRSLRAFEPLEPGKASIYLCGLTVQGPPHIGHVRNWVDIDVLRRWLEHSGYEVTFVRNVTDIDDKIIAKSADAGRAVVGAGVPQRARDHRRRAARSAACRRPTSRGRPATSPR